MNDRLIVIGARYAANQYPFNELWRPVPVLYCCRLYLHHTARLMTNQTQWQIFTDVQTKQSVRFVCLFVCSSEQ